MSVDFKASVKSLFFLLFCPLVAFAEGIEFENWQGRKVAKFTGPIGSGSLSEIKEALKESELFPHGYPVLLLDSLGGSVAEALRISEHLDTHHVHTVVPDGAKCASACASIVFIAGKLRTIEPFGLIGQHSCSVNGIADQRCNELLSQHALKHGVSHGSVSAFVTFTPPSKVLWFSREDADGWGLTRYPGELASGFQKSEPRAIKMITGEKPAAQSAWRLDIRNGGYRAFLRPAADDERELQLNVFCYESLPGRLFVSMEIHGPTKAIEDAIRVVSIQIDGFSWSSEAPLVLALDKFVSEIIVEIPSKLILPFLRESEGLQFQVSVNEPFEPIGASTFLKGSEKNLIFAANNCAP